MSNINYNHLYYFWQVYRAGSVVGAAEAYISRHKPSPGKSKRWKSACRASSLSAGEGAGTNGTW
jgi:hypothetical protein